MINDMVKGLYAHIGKPVVRGNQSTPRPPKPYLQYVPLVETLDQGTGNESQEGIDYQNNLSVSFSCFGNTPQEAYELAKKALRWFKYYGYDYLISKGIVVVEALSIETRDVLEVDKYDYRQGFDVVFRTLESLESDGNFIEFYTIEGGTNG